MNKRLIFNFYIDENWKENHINKIHLYCLEYYKNVFDEMIFMVSLNDIKNDELIYDFEQHILSLKLCTNIRFIVKQNHIFREAKNFYDEIATKLNENKGFTFFAHNKGITNYYNDVYKKHDVEKWVTSMYYGCLERPDEMKFFLTDGRKLAYGTLLDVINDEYLDDRLFYDSIGLWLGKRRYFYMGTFFWMNCPMIKYYMDNNNVQLPELVDRWYAENFFANIFDVSHCEGFDMRRTYNYDDGGVRNIDKLIKFSFGEFIDNYFEFHNKVIENV
jgi:hypothetical protein